MKKLFLLTVILLLSLISIVETKANNIRPVGYLRHYEVIVRPDWEVDVIVWCVAPYNEYCTTKQGKDNEQLNYPKEVTRALDNIEKYNVKLKKSNSKERVYILRPKAKE